MDKTGSKYTGSPTTKPATPDSFLPLSASLQATQLNRYLVQPCAPQSPPVMSEAWCDHSIYRYTKIWVCLIDYQHLQPQATKVVDEILQTVHSGRHVSHCSRMQVRSRL